MSIMGKCYEAMALESHLGTLVTEIYSTTPPPEIEDSSGLLDGSHNSLLVFPILLLQGSAHRCDLDFVLLLVAKMAVGWGHWVPDVCCGFSQEGTSSRSVKLTAQQNIPSRPAGSS